MVGSGSDSGGGFLVLRSGFWGEEGSGGGGSSASASLFLS